MMKYALILLTLTAITFVQVTAKEITDAACASQEYRLVGFDTPETAHGKCPSEIDKGNRAIARLIKLLDSGTLDLTEVQCSCPPGTQALTKGCNFGRRCGRLTVDGKDVGEILITEGLAMPYVCQAPAATTSRTCPKQQSWCK